MKIAIDCRSLRKRPAGVPNFLINAINALASAQPDWEICLLTNTPFHPDVKNMLHDHNRVQTIVSPLALFPSIATLWYIVKVPLLIRRLKPDIFYTPIPNLPFWLPARTKTMISVHDMIFKQFPETMSGTNRWINWLLHDRSFAKADLIWAVSQYTRKQIEIYFPYRKCRSIMVGSAVDSELFHPLVVNDDEKAVLQKKYDLREKTLLFVGTLEPRKNLKFLLSLMPKLAERKYDLLVVGAQGWGKRLTSAEGGGHVHFAGFVPTHDLVKLYQLVTLYVSTSLNEGFGLPQLEAMSCGCPVVCPRHSAIEEVVASAGETVMGWDQENWIEAIETVASNPTKYKELGMLRAAQYRWENVIKDLVNYISTKS